MINSLNFNFNNVLLNIKSRAKNETYILQRFMRIDYFNLKKCVCSKIHSWVWNNHARYDSLRINKQLNEETIMIHCNHRIFLKLILLHLAKRNGRIISQFDFE